MASFRISKIVRLFAAAALCQTAVTSPAESLEAREQKSSTNLTLVTSEGLRALVDESALFKRGEKLQELAYSTPDRNRLTGSEGMNLTIDYIYETLTGLGDYYDVELEPFSLPISSGNATLAVDDVIDPSASLLSYSPAGVVVEEIVPVANLGCVTSDFPAEVTGNIALISRGDCRFGQKVAYAGAAGAAGAIIYNNLPGGVNASLGATPRPEGPFVPSVAISLESATAILDKINGGATVIGNMNVNSVITISYSNNILATTKSGDQNNILQVGGHADSVAAGPGINDDGSGTVALLELAVQLTKFGVKNAVRFSFWSGEEEGLVGSTYYVNNLPAEEQARIRMYLNFDMIASPNYVLAVYDGDGSAFNLTGPPGSAQAEALFNDYFNNIEGVPSVPTEFSGRSDYQAFINVGIPSGGLFTGAEGIKTAEQAELFGGQADVAYDVNYHLVGDTIDNCNAVAWVTNTRAIAHSIATYGNSWEGIPERSSNTTVSRRSSEPITLSPRARLSKSVRRQSAAVDERRVAVLGKSGTCGTEKVEI